MCLWYRQWQILCFTLKLNNLDLLDWTHSQEISWLFTTLLPIEIHSFSPFCGAAVCCSFLGGSLQTAISENTKSGNHFQEPKLKDILLQISLGLKYIHNSGMVHLDIKPSQYGSVLLLWPDSPMSELVPVCLPSVEDAVSWRNLLHLFP